MKVTITIEDNDIKITQDKPQLGAVKKKKAKPGAVKKISVDQKKKRGTEREAEEQEMVKTLKKMGV